MPVSDNLASFLLDLPGRLLHAAFYALPVHHTFSINLCLPNGFPTSPFRPTPNMLATALGNAAFTSSHEMNQARERPGFLLSKSANAIRTYCILFRDARCVLGHS